jgi:hypothetical protein
LRTCHRISSFFDSIPTEILPTYYIALYNINVYPSREMQIRQLPPRSYNTARSKKLRFEHEPKHTTNSWGKGQLPQTRTVFILATN